MTNKIQVRRGTASAAASNNAILAAGEPGWDSTNGILKIGDGTTHWNDLPAILGSVYAAVAAVQTAVTDGAGSVSNAALARLLAPFAFISAYQYGDSWGNNSAGSSAPISSAFGYRICAALKTIALVDRSVSGTRSNQIQQQVESTWTAPGYGLVILADVVLNDIASSYSDTHTREAFRSILAHLCAVDVAASGATALVYGPGWASGVSDGTSGRYVDVSWTGDTAYLRWTADTGAGATLTVKNTAGATVATTTTGSFGAVFSGVTKLAGFGAGTHTVRVAVTGGVAAVTGVLAQSSIPPTVLWNQPGPVAARDSTVQAAKITACAAVLPDFPTVVVLTAGGDWDSSGMISTDGLHLNDKGNDQLTKRGIAALAALGYRDGQNRLTQPVAYARTVPAYDTGAATTPSAPTGVAGSTGNQVNLSWTRGDDGGATATSQQIQASSNGGSTWATVVSGIDPQAASTVITSGLTQGTSYLFRVAAVNVHGTGTYSAASAAITAGAVPAVYSADALTGSGAMGTATTGGQAWASSTGTTYARTASGAGPTTITTNGQGDVYVNDTHSDGTFKLTIVTAVSGSSGLLFRYDSTAHTGYVLTASAGGKYTLFKRTSLVAFSSLSVASSGPNAANGDQLKVIANGSSINCYLNGALIISVTDSTYSGTSHGAWVFSSTAALFSTYEHNSSIS